VGAQEHEAGPLSRAASGSVHPAPRSSTTALVVVRALPTSSSVLVLCRSSQGDVRSGRVADPRRKATEGPRRNTNVAQVIGESLRHHRHRREHGPCRGLGLRWRGGSVVGCDLNVDSAAECQALVDFAVRTFGRIDVLFNNAAMAYFNWLEDITDEERDRNRREEADLVFYLVADTI
jgi:NAD(P)-dependent dehydrogenase (short-subunit alcohol dehydrogenase family)